MYNINFIYLFLDSIPICYNELNFLQDSNIIAYSHLRGILQISAMCLSLHTIIIRFKSKVCLLLRVGLTDICCNFNHCHVKLTNWSVRMWSLCFVCDLFIHQLWFLINSIFVFHFNHSYRIDIWTDNIPIASLVFRSHWTSFSSFDFAINISINHPTSTRYKGSKLIKKVRNHWSSMILFNLLFP